MKHKKRTLSDGDILRQSIDQPWMFGVLVDRYQKLFLRKSLNILKSKEAAEDAVADTFLKIYKNAYQFSDMHGASFKSWAYKILLHTCYTEAHRMQKNKRVESFDFSDMDMISGGAGEDEYRMKENRSYVQSVMSRMPQSLSRFLTLYFFDDKSQKEIAKEEHISENAVRSRIHRAKKTFRDIAHTMNIDISYTNT